MLTPPDTRSNQDEPRIEPGQRIRTELGIGTVIGYEESKIYSEGFRYLVTLDHVQIYDEDQVLAFRPSRCKPYDVQQTTKGEQS